MNPQYSQYTYDTMLCYYWVYACVYVCFWFQVYDKLFFPLYNIWFLNIFHIKKTWWLYVLVQAVTRLLYFDFEGMSTQYKYCSFSTGEKFVTFPQVNPNWYRFVLDLSLQNFCVEYVNVIKKSMCLKSAVADWVRNPQSFRIVDLLQILISQLKSIAPHVSFQADSVWIFGINYGKSFGPWKATPKRKTEWHIVTNFV